MSRLAGEWIRSSFTLPRRVEVIESDLSNGYLFLAILNQLGKLSEDEYERASDETDPDVVLANFGLVARSLSSKLGIKIKQTDVANIVSETPGAAASLVMKIKRWNESALDKKYSRAPDAYKKMIASQRPRDFRREKAVSTDKTPEEQFLYDARKVLDNGVFGEIDNKCLTATYETHTYKIEKSYQARKAQEEAEALEARQVSHDLTMTKIRDVTQANLDKDQGVTQKWMETIDIKRKRQVRDLQFELANIKIATLRRRNKNASLNEEQIKGFDAFEANMKRSGLGGNDDDGNMSISYEDMDNFTERIEEEARKKWPSAEETSDFLTQLKVRTANNRQARYEKARRKRRMQVEQASSNAASTLAELGESDAEAAEAAMAATRQLEEKHAAKEAHLAKVVEQAKESKAHITEEAEKSILALSESFDERKEEILATRAQQLEEVRLAREEKKAKKRQASTAVCGDMVAELMDEIFDGGASKRKSTSPEQKAFDFSDVTATSLRLLELAKEMADSGFEPQAALVELTTDDAWLPYAALGSDLGLWSVREVPPPPKPEPKPVGDSTSEEAAEGEQGEEKVEAEAGAVVAQEEGEGDAPKVQPEPEPEPEPEPKPTYDFSREATFVETAQTVSESIVESFSTCPPAPVPPAAKLDFSPAEQTVVSGTSKTVVVLTEGATPDLAYWEQARAWLGGKVCLWDTVQAVQLALPLAPLLEGKKPTINFSTLLEAFCGAVGLAEDLAIECPAALSGAALTPDTLKTCKEALAMAETITKAKDAVVVGGDVSATASGFTDYSCAILVGQTLAIRDYIRGQLSSHLEAESLPAQLSAFTIATRMFGAKIGTRCAVFARIVDWFQQGGQKENVPADEGDLAVAIASEAGVAKEAGAGGKKGKGKGKGTEESEPKISVLASVVWVRGGAISAAAGEGSVITEESAGADVTKAILDAYSLSATAMEEEQMQVDAQLWGPTEQYLLRFGQASPPEEGSPEAESYIAKPGIVPVYVMQMHVPEAHTGRNEEGEAEAAAAAAAEGSEEKKEDSVEEGEKERDEAEKEAPAPALQPIQIVNFTALVEGVLGSVVDSIVSPPAAEAETPALAQVLQDNSSRLSSLVSARRVSMSPADKMWLLHALGEHPLDPDEAFALHSSLCAARAKRVIAGGMLAMCMGTGSHGVEKEVQSQTAQLVAAMKKADQRWYDLCAEIASQHEDGTDLSEITVETLVCRLGSIIDDRHMQWLDQLSRFQATGKQVCGDLRGSLEVAVSLAIRLAAVTLTADEATVSEFTALFGSRAGYQALPWTQDSGSSASQTPDIGVEIDASFGEGFYASTVAGMDSDSRSVWEAAVASASTHPTSAEAPPSLEEVVRATLYKEATQSVSRVVVAASRAISSATGHLETSLASVAATVRTRYTYEHSILLEWRRQLTSEPQGSTAFLNQYYFGVSGDPQYDSIGVVSPPTCPVDVGEMRLSLSSLAAFAKALSAAVGALLAEDSSPDAAIAVESDPVTGSSLDGSVDDPVQGTENSRNMSVPEMFLSVVGTASRSLLTSVSNLPKGWKLQSKVQGFASKLLGLPSSPAQVAKPAASDTEEEPTQARRDQLAAWVVDLVLTLLYAEIPKSPSVAYAARLLHTVNNIAGPTFSAEDALRSFSGNSALENGWWVGDESDDAKEATASALQALVYACATGTDGHCGKDMFFVALCKAPATSKLSGFASSLVLREDDLASQSAPLAGLLNEGVHRALALTAAVEPVGSADTEEYKDYSPSAGSRSLTALLGPMIGAGAVHSIVSKANPKAGPAYVSADLGTFRALLAQGVKLPPASPPILEPVTEEASEGKGDGAGQGEAKGAEEGAKTEDAPTEEPAAEAQEQEPEQEHPETAVEPEPEAEPEPEVREAFVLRPAGVATHSTLLAWPCWKTVGDKLTVPPP